MTYLFDYEKVMRKKKRKDNRDYTSLNVLLAYAAIKLEFKREYLKNCYFEMYEFGELDIESPPNPRSYIKHLYRLHDREDITKLTKNRDIQSWRITKKGYDKLQYLRDNNKLPPRFDDIEFVDPERIKDGNTRIF